MTPRSARTRLILSTAMITLAVPLASGAAADVPTGGNAAASPAGPPSGRDQLPFSWQIVDSGSIGNLIGLDVVSDQVIWASSVDTAEVLLSVDGGDNFTEVAPEEGFEEGLQFYDVEANSADEALVLSSGVGPLSRVYRTTDGGATWEETFRAVDDAAFFNCIAMFDEQRGLAMGDSVDGKFQIILTDDGGATWTYAPTSGMPDSLEGEFGWAAGGACITATGRTAWFGSGAGPEARVFRSEDYGMTWTVASTGLAAGPSGGIMGVDFRTNRLGLAVGGDFTLGTPGLARSTDGGLTWDVVDGPAGYRTSLAWWGDLKGSERSTITDQQKTVFLVGLTGSDVSTDRGKTWEMFDSTALNTIDCLMDTSICWAAGGGGVLATLAVG